MHYSVIIIEEYIKTMVAQMTVTNSVWSGGLAKVEHK